LAEACEVPPKEHLAPLDLGRVFIEIVFFGLGLVDCVSGVEGA
jgi:hypothetical protein